MDNKSVRIHIKHGEGCRRYLVSGFGEAVSGKILDYHSHHPGAGEALIARAEKSCSRISWKSGPLPMHSSGELTFVFLAAMAGSKGGNHTFRLSAENEELLSFTTPAQGDAPFFQIRGREGTRMKFESQWSDQFNDHFGFIYLTLQDRLSYPRTGITFAIAGEDAASEDWFMVFCYPVSQFPSVVPEPVLKSINGQPAQILKVNYDNLFGNCCLLLESSMERIALRDLKSGANTFRLGVPAVEAESTLKVDFIMDGEHVRSLDVSLKPVKPRSVYILPFSHNDIGYTDLQENVRAKQCANIDVAISETQRTLPYPSESQARWNLEVIWALESWLEQTSAGQKQDFTDTLKSGHLGLNALHNNLLSGLCNDAELAHHLDFARKVTEKTGIVIDTAAVTDIPGFVWGLVKAMHDAGVRYFAIAPNNGDRVGHIYKLGDKPFYWESPSGAEKVLTWIFKAGYAMFHRERLSANGLKKALRYVQQLQDEDYPYEMVPLAYTISGDNGTPDETLPDFVRSWNSAFTSPKFIIATHQMFFHAFEEKYGTGLPTLKGDLTGYWEDGAASTALETRLNRNAADRLLLAEKLYNQFRPDSVPGDKLSAAWQKVILFDEHTWGAWNSVSEPDLPEVTAQWEFKRQLALDADRLSRELLEEFSASEKPGMPPPIPPADLSPLSGDFTAYENDWLRLTFAENDCAVSGLFHKGLNAELLAPETKLMQYLYMQGTDREHLLTATARTSARHNSGNSFEEIVLTGVAAGLNGLEITYRIYHNMERMDISVKLDKIAVRDKESVHLAFPFAVEKGILRYDCAGVMLEPEKDQLPGACRNFICPTGVVDISNPAHGISICLIDNPLIEIGGITAELPWLEHLEPSTRFYAYVMNNYWHTNYKADQSGEVTFRFVITFHKGFSPQKIIQSSRQKREEAALSS
jgi:hypothetical protein